MDNSEMIATYCPEDNKLRLYVGRVPRDEYEKLRAEGWVSTPKQGCDFVATWTTERRDTALDYAGVILDEDQSPADRAADRAERFSGYLEKRTAEATGHADRFDSGPLVHGFQSQARAERSAARHDRIAGRAVDCWSKAEYWQQRTAGVIDHALYSSRPDVRMGRIKTLEAELRGLLSRWNCPREQITSQAAKDWIAHTENRIAYENQMLEAQGGRAAYIEITVGGFIGGRQVLKVNKSNITGRVVSVQVKGPRFTGWQYRARNVPGADYALYQIDTERLPADAYRPPTEADLAAVEALKADTKAKAPKKDPCPLINPTDADAERLQAIWNSRTNEPGAVRRMTQAEYSAASGGSYSPFETVTINEFGFPRSLYYRASDIERHSIFKVRKSHRCVIVLTDKPQKPLLFAEMEAAQASEPTPETLKPRLPEIMEELRKGFHSEVSDILKDAAYVRWINIQSASQVSWTDSGRKAWEEFQATQGEIA